MRITRDRIKARIRALEIAAAHLLVMRDSGTETEAQACAELARKLEEQADKYRAGQPAPEAFAGMTAKEKIETYGHRPALPLPAPGGNLRELGLSTRAYNRLYFVGINRIEELQAIGTSQEIYFQLRRIGNCGRGTAGEIVNKLDRYRTDQQYRAIDWSKIDEPEPEPLYSVEPPPSHKH